jgi:hypothetical protein
MAKAGVRDGSAAGDVDLLHAFTQAVALNVQAPDRGMMPLAHCAEALVQRMGEPLEEGARRGAKELQRGWSGGGIQAFYLT